MGIRRSPTCFFLSCKNILVHCEKTEKRRKMDSEKLVQVAMNVIMHAGDARDYIRKAGTKLSALDLDGVEELLKKASAELVEAHKAQTSVLQNEAEGDSVPMTVLFSHAQDTLMTVESEQYMISILYQCLKNMKKGEK